MAFLLFKRDRIPLQGSMMPFLCVLGRRLPFKEYSRLVFPLFFSRNDCVSLSLVLVGRWPFLLFKKDRIPIQGGGCPFLFALARCLAMAEYSGLVLTVWRFMLSYGHKIHKFGGGGVWWVMVAGGGGGQWVVLFGGGGGG